jgi:hypothetical protein
MEQRQAVRISVQLRARLLRDDEHDDPLPLGADELARVIAEVDDAPTAPWQGWHDGTPREPAGGGRHRTRRPHSESGIVCSCPRGAASGKHLAHSARGVADGSGPVFALAIDGEVADLSRHGLFLRTSQALPLGAFTTVCLDLPDDSIRLRAQVVRVERGERPGLGVRFIAEQPSRRQVANYLMRCHAHGA